MAPKKTLSFEEALAELEENIDKLESGDLTLDTALGYFEKGVGLIRVCDEHLKRADGKLKEVLKDENGALVERLIGINLSSVLATGGDGSDA